MEKIMTKNSVQFRHSLLLLLTAVIWGMAFVSQSKGMDYMKPLTFNAARCMIGAAVLFFYALIMGKVKGKNTKEETAKKTDWKLTLGVGICCGLALTVANILQQYGINYTTVGKAGFLTTLYIIFVPAARILFGRKVPGQVWVGALIAVAGMYFLCVTEQFSISMGDTLVLLSAVAFAAHIVIVGRYASRIDGVMLSCIQFAVCGVICSVGALIFETPSFDQIWTGIGPLLYAGVLSCGVGYTLQIVGQRGVNPTVAALIMSLESVVATVAAWIAYEIGFLTTDQTMTGRQIWGCVLVFAAVVLVQLPEKWFQRKA